jgi:6-pyruvoyltetrahydropterin/6-carboxytetrahydropterin synthase
MRKFEFDAGHRVLRHESKCANLHGHRYVAEVVVESGELDGIGRVVDFGFMKELFGGWIDSHWDHNILLHPEDPLAKLPDGYFSDIFDRKDPYIMLCGDNPTAENMARELAETCHELLLGQPHLSHVKVVGVCLWETPNCYAEYCMP